MQTDYEGEHDTVGDTGETSNEVAAHDAAIEELNSVISELVATCLQQRQHFQAVLEDARKQLDSVADQLRGDKMQLREELARERQRHTEAIASCLQARKARDTAEQQLAFVQTEAREQLRAEQDIARAVIIAERDKAKQLLADERAAHVVTIAERNKAERLLADERAAHVVTIAERNKAERLFADECAAHSQTKSQCDSLICELNQCRQQQQELQAALQECQQQHVKAALENAAQLDAQSKYTLKTILTALETAAHGLEYLAEIGDANESNVYSGFMAAIRVVEKLEINESS